MGLPILAQAAQETQASGGTAELVVFVLVGALSVGSAVSMVVMRNTVHAALMLVVNFFTIAVFYAVNEAQFLAAVQIIVYAGAVMVLFLFVIMLLGVGTEDAPTRRDSVRGMRASGVVLGVVLFAALAIAVGGPYLTTQAVCGGAAAETGAAAADTTCRGLAAANEPGNTQAIGALLFSRYVWPFEVASVLLVVAAIGAMVIGRRSEDPADLVDRVVVSETRASVEEPTAALEVTTVGRDNPAPSAPAGSAEPPQEDL